MGRASLGSRLVAAVCGVAVLLGASACNDGSSMMKAGIGQESGPQLDTDGEPFIHANHNRGADPNIRVVRSIRKVWRTIPTN